MPNIISTNHPKGEEISDDLCTAIVSALKKHGLNYSKLSIIGGIGGDSIDELDFGAFQITMEVANLRHFVDQEESE